MEETSVAGQLPESTLDLEVPAVVDVPGSTGFENGEAGTVDPPHPNDVAGVDEPASPAVPPSAQAVPPPTPAVDPGPRWKRMARGVRPHIAAILVAVAVIAICRYNQHAGHDYGDDFSLYIRQAKAITNGHVRSVIKQNEFTVDASSWHSFSPSIYPWGFPILLAPFYAIGGIDYNLFKLFEAVLFGAFLLLLYGVVNKRIGRLGGLVVMTTIGLSVAYVGWTDTVLSDIPYLVAVFLVFWLLDRATAVRAPRRTERSVAETATAAWAQTGFEGDGMLPLILLGVGAGFAYTTRSEGIALVPAMLAAQVAYLIGRWSKRDRAQTFRIRGSRLLTPLASSIAFIAVLHVILPAPFVVHYDNTGLKQVRKNLQAYGFSLAEQIGLKDTGRALPGQSLWSFAGSESVAKAMFAVFLTLAGLGIIFRLATAFADDIALFTYMVVVTLIIGIAPFRDSRYIFSLTPLLVYFAYQGIAGVPELFRRILPSPDIARRFVAAPIAAAFVALLMIGNATDTWHKTKFRYDTGTYTLDGVGQPSWRQMFGEVRSATKPTDVVAFFRARTMVLYTDRNAIQSTDINIVIKNADYYAQRKDPSNYSQAPLTSQEASELGFHLVWENTEFELWQVPKK